MSNKNFYLEQKSEIKAKVLDKIINHLFVVTKDPRHRERLRVKIALRKIEGWIRSSNGNKNI